jgi:hypothetical protein
MFAERPGTSIFKKLVATVLVEFTRELNPTTFPDSGVSNQTRVGQ